MNPTVQRGGTALYLTQRYKAELVAGHVHVRAPQSV